MSLSVRGVPAMKTCPACHRAVPDDAAACPHPGCGHPFGTSRTIIKRPPPPPTHVHVSGNDPHPAPPRPIGPPPAAAARSSRGLLLVWLFAILVGSGAVAAGLLAYLPRSQKKEAPPVEVAVQPLRPTSKAPAKAAAPSSTQTSDKKAPAESGGDKTKPLRKTAAGSQKNVNAAGAEAARKAETAPTKPDEPLG